jgi:hypothetical protein
MRQEPINRVKVNALGRVILSVFIIAWLNLALQPCLMAMAVTPQPTTAMAHAAHGGQAGGQDCDHCPPTMHHAAVACIGSTAQTCGSGPDYSIDAHNKLPEPKDVPVLAALAALPPQADPGMEKDFVRPPDRARLRFADEPSLNARYCVYLK